MNFSLCWSACWTTGPGYNTVSIKLKFGGIFYNIHVVSVKQFHKEAINDKIQRVGACGKGHA